MPAPRRRRSDSADLGDVLGCRALVALHHVELDALALGQALEAPTLDCRVMDEAVLAAILRRDESEALRVIEPLHFTRVPHAVLFSLSLARNRKRPDQNQASLEISGFDARWNQPLAPRTGRTICCLAPHVKGRRRRSRDSPKSRQAFAVRDFPPRIDPTPPPSLPHGGGTPALLLPEDGK